MVPLAGDDFAATHSTSARTGYPWRGKCRRRVALIDATRGGPLSELHVAIKKMRLPRYADDLVTAVCQRIRVVSKLRRLCPRLSIPETDLKSKRMTHGGQLRLAAGCDVIKSGTPSARSNRCGRRLRRGWTATPLTPPRPVPRRAWGVMDKSGSARHTQAVDAGFGL